MKYAKIVSTGIYSPKNTMTNAEFEKLTGVPIDPHFSEVIGINHRHLSSAEETPAFMAAEAGKMALKNANVSPEELDLIIVGTDTPENVSPPTSAKVQYLLGAYKSKTKAFDVNASCANGALMLDIASRYIALGDTRKVLVIGTYAMTKFLSWRYSWEALFSDGAGAVLLEASDEPGYLGGVGLSDGSYWNFWGIFMGAGTMNVSGIERGLHLLDLRRPYPPTVNEEGWVLLFNDLLEKTGFSKDDLGMIFFTQVRRKTIFKVMDALELPYEKTHNVMDKYGYTGSACVYLAVPEAIENGKMKDLEGKVVIFITSGVGYSQYAVAFRW